MKRREDLIMAEARKAIGDMGFAMLDTYGNDIMGSGEYSDPSNPNYEIAKAKYLACMERKLELQGIDPYQDHTSALASGNAELGPTAVEREAKLREEGYETQADLLKSAINADDAGDSRGDHEAAKAAALKVNIEIANQMQAKNEEVAERNK